MINRKTDPGQERFAQAIWRNRNIAEEAGQRLFRHKHPTWFFRLPNSLEGTGDPSLATEFLTEIQEGAFNAIGWVFTEVSDDSGRGFILGLVWAVRHLDPERWQRAASERFGPSRILRWNSGLREARDFTKGFANTDDLRFGGELWDPDSAQFRDPTESAQKPLIEPPKIRASKKVKPSDMSAESPRRFFLSAAAETDGKGAVVAWLNVKTGKSHVEVLPGLNVIEAVYSGLRSMLEHMRDHRLRVQVISDDPLLSGQFHGISPVCGHRVQVLRVRIFMVLRQRQIDLDVICVPKADNRAWNILKRRRLGI